MKLSPNIKMSLVTTTEIDFQYQNESSDNNRNRFPSLRKFGQLTKMQYKTFNKENIKLYGESLIQRN